MAINGVLRPGHVAIRVREMDPAVRHYIEVLGLIETARDAQGRVYLKAWDEHDHHSVVLREATDPGMDYMGWRVDSTTTLKKLAADVEGSGLASEMSWIPAGEHPMTGERFRFTIPTGHVMELFAEKAQVGSQRRALGQRFELSPGDLRVDASAETAVGGGDDPLPADEVCEAQDPLGDKLRVLDNIGGVANDTGKPTLKHEKVRPLPGRAETPLTNC